MFHSGNKWAVSTTQRTLALEQSTLRNLSAWLSGPAWLKRPENERPEQMNLIFVSDEKNIASSVFMLQAEGMKAIIQWEQFSNFIGLVNTVAYVQRELSKGKPATLVVSVEEREKAKPTIFKLLQQEQLAEEIKFLKSEIECPKGSEILQFLPLREWRSTYSSQRQNRQSQLDINANHPILLHWKHYLNYSCNMSTRTINTRALSM